LIGKGQAKPNTVRIHASEWLVELSEPELTKFERNVETIDTMITFYVPQVIEEYFLPINITI